MNVMNRFTLVQRRVLDIYFHYKDNWAEIARKCLKFGRRKGLIVPGMQQFIAEIRETGFITDVQKRKRSHTVRIP